MKHKNVKNLLVFRLKQLFLTQKELFKGKTSFSPWVFLTIILKDCFYN